MNEVLNNNADKITKIIVISGYFYSNYQNVYDLMVKAGLAEAISESSDMLLPEELQRNILKSYDVETPILNLNKKINPTQEWVDQANKLIEFNKSNKNWGWADPYSILLLDFWKELNPNIFFVLTYDAPEIGLAKAFLEGFSIDSPSDVDALLKVWIHSNAEILRFYYRNPERCVLVNSAVCKHEPILLLEKINGLFDVDLLLDNIGITVDDNALIVNATLLKSFCDNNTEVNKIFNELDVSADIPCPSFEILNFEKRVVLESYNKAFGESARQIEILKEELLEKEVSLQFFNDQQNQYSDLQTQWVELTNAFEALKKQLDVNKSLLVDVEHENELLILQLHYAEEEIETITQERDEQAKKVADLQAQNQVLNQAKAEQDKLVAEQAKKVADLQAQNQVLNQAKAEQDKLVVEQAKKVADLQAQLVEDEDKDQLLLLHLHQLQEELEFYSVDSQKCIQKINALEQSLVRFTHFWQENQSSEIVIDFRHEVDGDNWYQAEEDGRWAGGLSLMSTLKIPALRQGRYEFFFDVVDSMSREILNDLEIYLNGRLLASSLDSNDFPIYVYGEFLAHDIEISPLWIFELKFSSLISPIDLGLTDDRNLAIRVRSLVLRLIE